jgi:hypothetical protein
VARFEGDDGRLSDRLASEIAQRYPVNVIRTCLSVATVDEARPLRSDRSANLLLWGKATGGNVELHGEELYSSDAEARPTIVARDRLSAFLDDGARALLIEGVVGSHHEELPARTPAQLASYADQVERFVRKVEERASPSGDPFDDLRLAQDKVRLHSAAGNWMLSAGAALRDGGRIGKSIAHFRRASAIRNSNAEYQEVMPVNWNDAYEKALLWDAKLNRSQASARRAADRYQTDYDRGLANPGVTAYHRSLKANAAASAWKELATLSRDPKARRSANRLACESLLWSQIWQIDSAEAKKANMAYIKKGLSLGIVPSLPPPEKSEAYRILKDAGKDPSPIFRVGRNTLTKYCTAFE